MVQIYIYCTRQVVLVSELFMWRENVDTTVLVIVIVDDLLLSGTDNLLRKCMNDFNNCFRLCRTGHGPDLLRLLEMSLINEDEYTSSVNVTKVGRL